MFGMHSLNRCKRVTLLLTTELSKLSIKTCLSLNMNMMSCAYLLCIPTCPQPLVACLIFRGGLQRCLAGRHRGRWKRVISAFQDELGSASPASITACVFRMPWKCQQSWPSLSPHQSVLRLMRRCCCRLAGQAPEPAALIDSLPFRGG